MNAFFGVFIAMTALDFVWAEYTKAVAAKRPVRAALTASCIIALSGVVTTQYVENHYLLVAAVMGAFCGTYLAMRRAI